MYASSSLLSGKKKAAILLISLGQETAANIFKKLKEEELEVITLEIANQKKVTPEQKQLVISEFYQMCKAKEYISEGGLDYARTVLEKAVGLESALSVINKLTSSLKIRPFDCVRNTDPSQ